MLLLPGRRVELDGLRQIDLGDHRDVGGIENGRIFERLVSSPRLPTSTPAAIFAEVIARRANQVADIFDEQDFQPGAIRPSQRGRTMSASRWQIVPVVICLPAFCFTAWASLSVARSPTSAAARCAASRA